MRLSIGVAAESEPDTNVTSITLISPTGWSRLPALISSTPEDWQQGTRLLRGLAPNTALVLRFPSARYRMLSAVGAPCALDALLLNGEGQILAVYRNLDPNRPYSHPYRINAVVFACSDPIADLNLDEGHLVLPTGFSFRSSGPPDDSVSLETIRRRLEHHARKANVGWEDVAALYLARGDTRDALRCYDRSLARRRTPEALVGGAMVHVHSGQMDSAMRLFAEVLEHHPTHIPAYRRMTTLLQGLKQTEMIVPMLRTGLERHPELLPLRLELARLYLNGGNPSAATAVLDAAPEPSVREAAAIARVMGDIHLRQGNLRTAADSYVTYLKQFPNAPHAAELRIFISRHGQPQPADQ